MIHYYTKLLGMRDTITQDDILVDSEAKSKLEKELETQKQNNALFEEKLRIQAEQLERVNEIIESLRDEKKLPKTL